MDVLEKILISLNGISENYPQELQRGKKVYYKWDYSPSMQGICPKNWIILLLKFHAYSHPQAKPMKMDNPII